MKPLISALAILALTLPISPEKQEVTCQVTLCNRLKRWSINPFKHLKDKMGEVCFDAIIPKSDAVQGKELSSESRWWQGKGWNFTKRSVVYVKSVYECSDSE